MSFVFLSYAGTDRLTARQIKHELTALGLDVWMDESRIQLADNWMDKLQEAICHSDAYVILIGHGGIKKWVKKELYVALNRSAESNDQYPICPIMLPDVEVEDLPPFLAIYQAVKLAPEPTPQDYENIAGYIKEGAGRHQTISLYKETEPNECPFPGLESYNEKTAKYYFGRRLETLETLSLLGSVHGGTYRPWLQIEGPSGVGKSSLVKAGMIPAIRRGWIGEGREQEPRNWHVGIMRPGKDPVYNLAESLTWTLDEGSSGFILSELKTRLRGSDPDVLRDYIRQRVPKSGRFLLVVDQLEEIFTICDDAASRARYDTLIATALGDREAGFHLITTIRSDFTLQLEQLPRLAGLLSKHAERYYLNPIDEKGLREVLSNSMRRAGLEWEEPTLPERIITNARQERNALPLVNKLLWLLWQRRDDNVLSAKLYEELGGVGGALARSADRLLQELGKRKIERARQLFLRLIKLSIDSNPTRRTIPLTTARRAAGGGPAAEEILRHLSGAPESEDTIDVGRDRLIYIFASYQPGESSVDLAHEALITHWGRLKKWINIYRDKLYAADELEEAAQHWRQSGKPRLPGVPSRSLMKRYRSAAAPSELADGYLRALRIHRRLRMSLLGTLIVSLLGITSFGAWINHQGLSVRTGMYLILASTGLYYLQPEMVKVPSGTFWMGASSNIDPCGRLPALHRNKLPRHEVSIEREFLIGKYEVTYAEYDLYARLSGSVETPSDDGWGRGKRPVIWVSLKEAAAYAKWLSDMTGKSYRLPTEAEWEYAARAGTSTNYWWGDDMQLDMANCSNCSSDQEGRDEIDKTMPVGSFPANPFGLHETAGNVMEWVQDCWHDDYVNAPSDGSAWGQAASSQCYGVLRGGAWEDDECNLFCATRRLASPDAKDNRIGFRLVQDLQGR